MFEIKINFNLKLICNSNNYYESKTQINFIVRYLIKEYFVGDYYEGGNFIGVLYFVGVDFCRGIQSGVVGVC